MLPSRVGVLAAMVCAALFVGRAQAQDFDMPLPDDVGTPAAAPAAAPAKAPAAAPAAQPAMAPAAQPAAQPAMAPAAAPAAQPAMAPAAQPAAQPATAPAAQPAAQPTPAAQPAAATADEAFDLKTMALEEQVNDLKEKILKTKYRLAGLAETVLSNTITGGAKLSIWHRNELGSSYVLTSAIYTMDGAPLFTKVDETGDLNEREEFVIFDQRAVPGQHQINVQFELRGNGYGIFSYLNGMRTRLRMSYQFSVEPGKITKVVTRVYEKSGITLEFADKPNIDFGISVQKEIPKPAEQDDAAPGTDGQAQQPQASVGAQQ